MRVKPDSGKGSQGKDSKEQEEPEEKRRLDLSVPQVAGSAIAAVVAAKLASNLGVYGTILGAGVVSGIATCGGTIFQHFFKRTGEQIRVVAVQAKPKAHQVPLTTAPSVPETFRTAAYTGAASATGPVTTTWGRPREADAEPDGIAVLPSAADATTALPTPDADPTTALPSVASDLDADRTQRLGSVDATQLVPREDGTRLLPRDDATRVLRAGPGAPTSGTSAPGTPTPGTPVEPPLPSDEFTVGTTHRARIRSWKRPLIAAAVVFGVAMGGITTYELISGEDLSGGKGTTISNGFSGNNTSKERPSTPSEPSGQPSDNGTSGTGDGTQEGGGTATPDPDGTGGQTPGQGDGNGSGTGGDGSKNDPDDGTGTDPDKDKGDDSGDDGAKTDPTPTPPPAPTPSSGTGPGSGTGADGDAQQGETTSP
ncbi:hypothetical protein DMA15_28170 [Streptomyces sp. WAC 01529]|uniref:hypothetical protein n=1 Tax=Streptomyces sp. WAC 01529 TaxID=2203205 RepID=UPI000F716648|nr:hypothetical protein [Streptomyces sp. WAC 01529]AZM55989.1 hypothetical protein DMA15_28170 [Streptomyces sp. WAC 01529]